MSTGADKLSDTFDDDILDILSDIDFETCHSLFDCDRLVGEATAASVACADGLPRIDVDDILCEGILGNRGHENDSAGLFENISQGANSLADVCDTGEISESNHEIDTLSFNTININNKKNNDSNNNNEKDSVNQKNLFSNRKEKWALKVFTDWHCAASDKEYATSLEALMRSSDSDLSGIFVQFLRGVTKGRVGGKYPACTLKQIILSVQHHMRKRGRFVWLLADPKFKDIQDELGVVKNSKFELLKTPKEPTVDIIGQNFENQLWESGILSDGSPRLLLDTMFYLLSVCFGISGGAAHRHLRHAQSQLQLIQDRTGKEFLRYTVDKRNSRKQREVSVDMHYEGSHHERSVVTIYKLYNSKCPPNRPSDAYYLQPLMAPTQDCWYSNRPVGKDQLSAIPKRISEKCGVEMNTQMLKLTCANRLGERGYDRMEIRTITDIDVDSKPKMKKQVCHSEQEKSESMLFGDKYPSPNSSDLLLIPTPTCTLVVSTVKMEPFVMGRSDFREAYDFEGFIPDLLNLISRLEGTNFRFILNDKFGRCDHTGQWSGLVSDVISKKCDVAAAAISVTSSREDVVDFTQPFMDSSLCLVYRKSPDISFSTFEEFICCSQLPLFVIKNGCSSSFLKSFLRSNVFDTNHVAMLESRIVEIESVYDALESIRTGSCVSLIEQYIAENLLNCEKYFSICKVMQSVGYAFMVQQGSPLRKRLSKAILRLRESGEIYRLYKKWWKDRKVCDRKKSHCMK